MGLKELIAGAGLLAASAGCCSNQKQLQNNCFEDYVPVSYDNSSNQVTDETLDSMLACTYGVHVEGKQTYFNFWKRKQETQPVTFHGSCIAYKQYDDKVLLVGVAHLFDPADTEIDEMYLTLGPYNDNHEPSDDADNPVVKYKARLVYSDRAKDLAIAYVYAKPDELITLEDAGIELADPDQIKRGDVTYSTGFPYWEGKRLNFGVVTGFGERTRPHVLYSSAHLSPGYSGGGTFVTKDGKAYLAGLNSFMYVNAGGEYGTIFVKEYMEKLAEIDETWKK